MVNGACRWGEGKKENQRVVTILRMTNHRLPAKGCCLKLFFFVWGSFGIIVHVITLSRILLNNHRLTTQRSHNETSPTHIS